MLQLNGITKTYLVGVQLFPDHCLSQKLNGVLYFPLGGWLGPKCSEVDLQYTPFHFTLNRDCTSRIAGMVKGRKWCQFLNWNDDALPYTQNAVFKVK